QDDRAFEHPARPGGRLPGDAVALLPGTHGLGAGEGNQAGDDDRDDLREDLGRRQPEEDACDGAVGAIHLSWTVTGLATGASAIRRSDRGSAGFPGARSDPSE